MDKEQFRKQLESCKKSFYELKYSDCVKLLQKITKDYNDSKLTSKLRLNLMIAELHKNKFAGLDTLAQFASSLEHSLAHGSSSSHLGAYLSDENCVVSVYNCALICFYIQQFERVRNLIAALIRRSTETDNSVSDIATNWSKLMDKCLWDISMKYNLCLLFSEASLKLWESYLIKDIEREVVPVLNWLEHKLNSDKSSKNVNERWLSRLSILKNMVLLTNENNLKLCKKEMRSLTPVCGSNPNLGVPAAFIRSRFEYLRKNYIKSIKALQFQQYRSHFETGESIPLMYYNNLACVHYQMGKYALGLHYAKKAFSELEKLEQQASKTGKKNSNTSINSLLPLHTVSAMKVFELHYNMGMQLLAAKMPERAFESFFNAVQMYYHSPKLWLKLAECCVAVHHSKTIVEASPSPDSELAHVKSLGSGHHHKLLIRSQGFSLSEVNGNCRTKPLSRNDQSFRPTTQEDVQSAAFPAATLGFGALCIENTLLLAKKCRQNSSTDQADMDLLMVHAMTCGAYINLCIGDYLKTLSLCQSAMSLLESNKQPYDITLMRHLVMYKSEALILLDQISKATETLTSYESVFKLQKPSAEDPKLSSEQSLAADRWALHKVSLAVTHVLRGEIDDCKALLQSVAVTLTSLHKQLPTECYLLSAYLEVCQKNFALAAEILQRKQIPNYESISNKNNNTSNQFLGAN